ncbi:hypothetical protein BD289DRAFT_454010 [Coniella lustricola]|uniref:FAD-binding PCMH-type domain-containing protein n=1 Tax=Coniella lustricola TaxID=2025994 RepID=A0A2T3A550_9PEZI|nr:hypothetical protein BD289DRAFT_454010 [Coniella lustricola]
MPAKLSPQLFEELQQRAGSGVEILTEPADARFQDFAKRWSDIDRHAPAAIVLPETEEQIQKVVSWAVQASVPFVAKSGGHSNWSTIGDNGFVIDLSKYSAIEVDAEKATAKIRGSILIKALAVHLADAGYFAGGSAVGNGTQVGAIPYFLNGGASITTSLTGFGSDQILAARMVDAQGNLVDVTSESEPQLLYGIRGAGQFFGLITELTIKIWPLQELGNGQGLVWSGRFIFPLDRAREVAEAMKVIMDNDKESTGGLIMAICPPPARKAALVVAARHVGNIENAKDTFAALYDLKPLIADGGPVPIQNISDGREALEAKGGFKTFGTIGLRRFDITRFLQTIDVWKRLVEECPDAINTTYNFQWDSRPPRQADFESANSLHDIRYWQNNIIWYTDAGSHKRVAELNAECLAVSRGPDQSEYADFQNATRVDPIEFRFRGEGKLDKLRALKEKWDPKGVFTRQLLN